MSQHLPRTLLVALCATTAVALAGCSAATGTTTAAGDPASSSSATTASAPSASAAPTKASTGAPTGAKLKPLLLPAASLPAHLVLEASGSRDTGDTFNPPSDGPAPTSKNCDALNASSWISATGMDGLSFAENDYTDSSGRMFAQELDGYRGADAKTAMARVTKLFTVCGSFKSKQGSTTYTTKLTQKKLTGVGDEAFEAVLVSPTMQGGATLIAVRVGNVVVSTLYNDMATTGGADLALTKTLVKRVRGGL